LSDAHSKSFSFASVATATQIILTINIQFPHPFTPTRTPSIQVFHYFCLSLFAGWPTSVLPFRCLFIDQIIVYNAFYSKLTFYIIKDHCQMHALKVFRSPVWLLLHKLSSPHYRYISKPISTFNSLIHLRQHGHLLYRFFIIFV
jgi:hypothetical protein